MIETKTLDQVLREHTEKIEDRWQTFLRFPKSGNLYRHYSGFAIDNFAQTYVPIIDGIERSDMMMSGAPFVAAGMLLRREGIIS